LMVCHKTSRRIQFTTDNFLSWSDGGVNIGPSGTGFNSLWKATGQRILATLWNGAAANVQRVYRTDDKGATWVACGVGSDEYTFIGIAGNGQPYPGANIMVAFATKDAGGDSAIFKSVDNGNSWFFVQLVASGSNLGGVAYSPVWDKFMIVDGANGTIMISADGESWTTRTSGISSANGLVDDHPLACVGSVFAVAMKVTTENGSVGGIAYSFDIGSTWFWVPLSHPGDTDRIVKGVKALGNRFVAMAKGGIYVSQHLANPIADITSA